MPQSSNQMRKFLNDLENESFFSTFFTAIGKQLNLLLATNFSAIYFGGVL